MGLFSWLFKPEQDIYVAPVVQETIEEPVVPEKVVLNISQPVWAIVESMEDLEAWKEDRSNCWGMYDCWYLYNVENPDLRLSFRHSFNFSHNFMCCENWATSDEKDLLAAGYDRFEQGMRVAKNKQEREKFMVLVKTDGAS